MLTKGVGIGQVVLERDVVAGVALLAYLVAAKSDDFRAKIFDNISHARKNEVAAQEEILKPMRRSTCEEITGRFVGILRHAYEDGKLVIKGRNEEAYI